MKTGTGFFLSVGIALGIALFSHNNWWWQGLIGVIIITLLHIITKSDMLVNSINNCKVKKQSFSLGMFMLVNVLINVIIVGVTFGVIRLVQSII